MKNLALLISLSSIILIGACKDKTGTNDPVPAVETEYKIDGYNNDSAEFQAGFKNAEIASVVLGPIDETFTVTKIHLLFGGNTNQATVRLRLYWDEGKNSPGEMLYDKPHTLTGSNDIQTINIKDSDVKFHGGGSFRVAVVMQQSGLPCIARDTDGTISKTLNHIYASGNWLQSYLEGLKGDFIIRATVETTAR